MCSQCQACGPRKKVNVRDTQDELDVPSGPLYKNCESAPDSECCATLQKFHININNYDDASVTSCSGICALLGRDGSDGACLPENPRCNNWHNKQTWPSQGSQTYSEEVGAWCLCSGKSRARQPKATIFDGVTNVPTEEQLARSVPAGSASTTSAGVGSGYGVASTTQPSWPNKDWRTDSANPEGRRLLYDNATRRLRSWQWPEATVKGVDSMHVKTMRFEPHPLHTAAAGPAFARRETTLI